jgi:hypothetical protein
MAATTGQNCAFQEGAPLKIVTAAGTASVPDVRGRDATAAAAASPSIEPQCRHLMAASWISSAQKGQGFIGPLGYAEAGPGGRCGLGMGMSHGAQTGSALPNQGSTEKSVQTWSSFQMLLLSSSQSTSKGGRRDKVGGDTLRISPIARP